MTARLTRIGLIGAGRIAQLFHLPILARLTDARLVAVADPDADRLTAARRLAPAARCFADYRDLLTQADAEAVVICAPPALHAETAIAAFEAGRHVYLEKPLATNLADGRRVVAAWQRAGTTGMIGFNFRFHPLYRRAKALIDAGRSGSILGARSVLVSAARTLPPWKQTRATGGGALLDLASHHVDLARYLLDQPFESVTATLESRRSEDDTAALQLRLRSGAIAQIFCAIGSADDHRFEIYAERGRIAIDRTMTHVEYLESSLRGFRLHRLQAGLRLIDPRNLLRSPGAEPSFALALGAFVDAARTGRAIQPDLLDGYRSLAVIVAAEEAARSGRAARLTEPTDAAIPAAERAQ